jgi:hypothetical protein
MSFIFYSEGRTKMYKDFKKLRRIFGPKGDTR